MRNGLQEKKRSFFVVVGDRSKDVIVNLHFLMSQFDIKQNKSVLWAYKNKLLGFTRYVMCATGAHGAVAAVCLPLCSKC